MAGNVWVLAEQWRGEVSEITYEVLALGSELAMALGVKLQAVLLGRRMESLAETLGKADSVLYVDHAALEEPTTEALSAALSQLVKEGQPHSVLIPLTNITLGVEALIAAQLQLPAIPLGGTPSTLLRRLDLRLAEFWSRRERPTTLAIYC